MSAIINDVFEAIKTEREYQDRRWGTVKDTSAHDLGTWLLILEQELFRAKSAWMYECTVKDMCYLVEPVNTTDAIRKIAGVATAVLEQHGVRNREGL